MKKKKICYISSSGGHWEELQGLKTMFNKYESFFITEKSGQISDNSDHLYVFAQINRKEKGFYKKLVFLFFSAFNIIGKEKPDVIITTGALIAFPFCIVAKLRGIKIIYIESFARIYNKSLTGKLLYPFSDLFIVQWKEMLELYPKAKYLGKIF